MTILVLNAGSSTLKFAAFEQNDGLALRFKDQVRGRARKPWRRFSPALP